jgi:hypothetical protein
VNCPKETNFSTEPLSNKSVINVGSRSDVTDADVIKVICGQ